LNSYRVAYTRQALKQLSKLDKHTQRLLTAWIGKNLQGCNDPRRQGKALSASLSSQWRYRVGNYRIITEIEDEKIIILVLTVGHRKDIYKKFEK